MDDASCILHKEKILLVHLDDKYGKALIEDL